MRNPSSTRTLRSVLVPGVVADLGAAASLECTKYLSEAGGGRDASLAGLRIIRLGTAGRTPTPESGGLLIRTGITSAIEVRNVLVVNTAPTQGAIELDFALSEAGGAAYASRTVIDGNAAEEDVEAVDAWTNDVRTFFGWNLVGTDLDVDSAVWLPRMSLDDAFAVARLFEGRYGVEAP